jgi:hypothetical protein
MTKQSGLNEEKEISNNILSVKQFVTLTVEWIECIGEAHSNPYIDNCMICLPYWGNYPVCPICRTKVKTTKRKHYTYYCSDCKKYLLEIESKR